MGKIRVALVLAACMFAASLAHPTSGLTRFNGDDITIPPIGVATPYPSPITVTGARGEIVDIDVSIDDITHGNLDDLGIVLVAPSGANLEIVGAVSAVAAAAVDFVIDDEATDEFPNAGAVPSGTYRPTAYLPDAFSPPAPVVPTHASPAGVGTLDSSFSGLSPNGTWNLFVQDFAGAATGSIGSWSIEFTLDGAPDGRIARLGSSSFTGDQVYSPAAQVLAAKTKRKKPVSFDLRFENEGDVFEKYDLTGCSTTDVFDVKYFLGAVDITAGVSGFGQAVSLNPGETTDGLTLTITPKKNKGTIVCPTTLTIQGSSTNDVVTAKVKIKRKRRPPA